MKKSSNLHFLLSIAAATAAAAAAAAALEEFELLLLLFDTPWLRSDFASKCSGLVSKLDETEATEWRPDR